MEMYYYLQLLLIGSSWEPEAYLPRPRNNAEDKELESRGDRSGLETEALPAVRHF